MACGKYRTDKGGHGRHWCCECGFHSEVEFCHFYSDCYEREGCHWEPIRTTEQLLHEGSKLIDDLCSAFKVTLLPDDQKIRDGMAKAGGE